MSATAPQVGSLTDRVQLRRREMLPEAEGGHQALFVPLGTVWARVRSLAGRQGTSADGRAVTVSHTVVLRFRNDVGPGDRLLYRGRSLEVVSATDLDGRRRWLACACSEAMVTG